MMNLNTKLLLYLVVSTFVLLFSFCSCERTASGDYKIKKRLVNFYLEYAKSDWQTFESLLKPLATVRVSGTPQNDNVKKFIVSKMQSYGWTISYDDFNDQTPYGTKSFSNVIATYPIGVNFQSDGSIPESTYHTKNRVVFACHYDSKYFTDIEFIGATDSAVPCAMLLELAKFLNEAFTKQSFKTLNRHIQFIFFDGEEAFKQWTDTDSIYGSRHLASTLYKNYSSSAFDSMDLFVLLDLLGASQSKFVNHFPQTSHVYNLLGDIENLLRSKLILSETKPYYFTDRNGQIGQYSLVDDDHKPFLKRNVPILHLIAVPFPSQWHTVNDNLQNLDQNRINDLRAILKYFLLQILNIDKPKKSVIDDEF